MLISQSIGLKDIRQIINYRFHIILVVIGLCLPARAHVSNEFITIPVLSGELEASIALDGAIDDWANVLGPPILTLFDLYGDPTETDDTVDVPNTYAVNVWLALVAPNRIYVALEWRDDIFSTDQSGEFFDGQVELLVDGNHSGGTLSDNAAQHCAIIPHIDGSVSAGYVGTGIDWLRSEDYIAAAANVEIESIGPDEQEIRGIVEFYVTAFDEISPISLEESVPSNLVQDRIWGLSLIFADVDSPSLRFVAVFGRTRGGASGLRVHSDEFSHVRSDVYRPTQMDFSTWGYLKYRSQE